MRFFLELSYRGTAYNGWQRQPASPTVQQALEEALSTLLREDVTIVGAGRTDTGVHAAYYVAHFDTAHDLVAGDENRPPRRGVSVYMGTPAAEFCYHLNALLPDDIAVSAVRRVRDDAHARFDARRREYRYHILPRKDPFRRDTTWQYYVPLDLEAMNRAAAMLLEHDDFTTFSKLHAANKTTICRVVKSQWENVNGELIYAVASDRFLRNMVRSLVGTLVDVGRGKITPERFGEILRAHDRSLVSGSAPAQGLFLSDVDYPDEIYL
ncbi:MAG: tRNA pseudouridine(38-40) synthase TruA [Rikenellaceae bacterium]|nr:tRNA pseudouridine(38-40) synthase TruA [Rikenellaceae bacterium]